jgi:MoxR-like ATPase
MKHIKMCESFSDMSGGDLKIAIEEAIKNPSNSKPILVSSSPGVGNTAMIGQIANDMGITMINIDCLTATIEDFGVPRINDRGRTAMSYSTMLPNDNGYNGKGGVIVFDEVNRADSQIMGMVMRMASTRQYNEYTLPDGWVIVLVTKTVDGDTSMGSALKDRFTYVDLGLM